MKKSMGVWIAVLCCWGTLVQGASLTPELSKERADAFAVVLQQPRLRQLLLQNGHAMKQNFTYASLVSADTDVLLVGETHTDSVPQSDVNLIIRDLAQAKAGFSYVASEFLLSSEQTMLNQFAQGKITYDQLRKSCTLGHRAYIAVTAKRYGLQVIGLDLPRAQENTGWAMSIEGMATRNQAWLQLLLAAKTRKPQGKILLYGGAAHTQFTSHYYKTMPQLLAQKGLKTKVIEFVNEKDPEWKKLRIQTKNDILFIIPKELKPYVWADYVVYSSPQDLDEEGRKVTEQVLESFGDKFVRNDSISDGCMYDPENGICKQWLRVRRAK